MIVILALILGPPVAGWLTGTPTPARAPIRAGVPPAPALAPGPGEAPVAVATPEPPRPTDPTGNSAAPAAETEPPPPGTARAPAAKAPERPRADGASALFRVQVGAFLDHRNADRLVQRLRAENLEVVDTVLEQSRVLYRVVALPAEGEGYGALVERLNALGLAPELTDDGAAVTGLMPLRSAVETARRLRDQGIRTRLDREAGAAAFRVVRVGGYPSAGEAERARAELAARGLEGIVVRER